MKTLLTLFIEGQSEFQARLDKATSLEQVVQLVQNKLDGVEKIYISDLNVAQVRLVSSFLETLRYSINTLVAINETQVSKPPPEQIFNQVIHFSSKKLTLKLLQGLTYIGILGTLFSNARFAPGVWVTILLTSLLIVRNRSKSLRLHPQVVVNQQPLCLAEIEILQELVQLSKTDWILERERQQRLSDRSLHHIVYQAGVVAGLPIPVHPYMLRRSGLYYRAVLLQTASLSLHECCLLWNYYATSSAMPASAQIEYQAINRKREETFLLAFEQIKVFSGISADENIIDYLLGAYLFGVANLLIRLIINYLKCSKTEYS